MKKTARIISLILSLALLAGAFGVVAYADGTPTVTVGTVQASAGEAVAVEVVLSDCARFSSYTISITYDNDYVTAVEARKGINVMLYMPNLTVDGKKEMLITGGDVDNKTDNGVIATLIFKIDDNFPGGVTEVPLTVTKCKLTEYNGKNDVEFASQSVSGKLVISGVGGNVIWNGDSGESELTPAKLTDDEASGYTNPISGEAVGGGEYYINEESKIAIPADEVEEGVKNDPDSFKAADDVPEVIEPPVSSEEPAQGSEEAPAGESKPLDWLLIVCICAGVCVVAAGVFAVVYILKKNKAKAEEPQAQAEPEPEPEPAPEPAPEPDAEQETKSGE